MKHANKIYLFLLCNSFQTLYGACTPIASTVGTSAWQIADTTLALMAEHESHIITNTNIPYPITEPGYYVLGEDIVDTSTNLFTVAIFIDNVTLDLNNKSISRPTGTAESIVTVNYDPTKNNFAQTFPPIRNIIVKNGSLILNEPLGTVRTEHMLVANVHGISIKNIAIIDNYLPISTQISGITISSSTDIYLKNIIINGFHSTYFGVFNRGTIAKNIHYLGKRNTFEGGITFQGADRNIVLLDSTSHFGNSCITINTARNVVFKRCIANNSARSGGISTSSMSNFLVEDCIAMNCGASNFNINGVGTDESVIAFKCISIKGGFFASSNDGGFRGFNASVISCESNENIRGYRRTGSVNRFTLVNCSAHNNSGGNFVNILNPSVTTTSIDEGTFWHNFSS